jgi:hypothetical protein
MVGAVSNRNDMDSDTTETKEEIETVAPMLTEDEIAAEEKAAKEESV